MAQVVAKPPQLRAGLGQRGSTMNKRKKASLEVKEEWGAEWGLATFQGKGV